MAAKKTPDLIPLCHPLALSSVSVTLTLDEARNAVDIEATCKLKGRTGVEMEALTAASVAALTVYDMCKAVDRGMVISEVKLLHKSGGKSGTSMPAMMLLSPRKRLASVATDRCSCAPRSLAWQPEA